MLRGYFGGRDVYLIGSGFEFLAGDFGDLVCYFDVEAFLCVDSLELLQCDLRAGMYCSDGGSALSEESQSGKTRLDSFNAILDLLGISREFLSQRQGSRIL